LPGESALASPASAAPAKAISGPVRRENEALKVISQHEQNPRFRLKPQG